LARERLSLSRSTAALAPLFVSLGLLLWYFRTLFGSATLSAAYGPGFSSDVSFSRIPSGGLALILDRQFGLLLFSPVLLFGLCGAWNLWKQNRPMSLLAVAVFGIQIGVGGAFSMWWGGASAPARFLIAAVPALLIVCAAGWQACESRPDRRTLLGAASGFGLGLLWLACAAPRALHNRPDGESGLLRLLAPVLDLDRFFPGFVTGDGIWLAGAWGLILIAAARRLGMGLSTGALPIAFAALTASTPLLDSFSSSLRLLESWSDRRRVFGGRDAESSFSMNVPLGHPPWDLSADVQRYSPRLSLPKGAWTLRVDSRSEGTPEAFNLARVSLRGGDERAPSLVSVTIRSGESATESDFTLTTNFQRVTVLGAGLQSRARVLSVRLTPRSLAP
jgi:hypothetical protein